MTAEPKCTCECGMPFHECAPSMMCEEEDGDFEGLPNRTTSGVSELERRIIAYAERDGIPLGASMPDKQEIYEAQDKTAETMRAFETGATRNKEVDPDLYGFTSPLALDLFGEYMHNNRTQADGTTRESDNWKKGIPLDSYIRSMRRHLQDLTLIHDGHPEMAREDTFNALGGLFFNIQGYMHEWAKAFLAKDTPA